MEKNTMNRNKVHSELVRLRKVEQRTNKQIESLKKRLETNVDVHMALEKDFERQRCRSLRAMEEMQIAIVKFSDDLMMESLQDEIMRVLNEIEEEFADKPGATPKVTTVSESVEESKAGVQEEPTEL